MISISLRSCILALAVTLITASASAQTVHQRPNEPDQITSKTASWGRPTSAWGVNRDGSGWTTSVRQGASFSDITLITRRWGATPGRYDEVRRSLKEAERLAGKRVPCQLLLTDGPYGDVTWRRAGVTRTLPIQYGCMSKTADRIYEQLDEVRAAIGTWAENAAPIEERTSSR